MARYPYNSDPAVYVSTLDYIRLLSSGICPPAVSKGNVHASGLLTLNHTYIDSVGVVVMSVCLKRGDFLTSNNTAGSSSAAASVRIKVFFE